MVRRKSLSILNYIEGTADIYHETNYYLFFYNQGG